jgi:ribosomal protein S13
MLASNYGFLINKNMMDLLNKRITNWKTTVWKTIRANHGLSDSSATSICARLGLSRKVKIKSLTTREMAKLRTALARNFIANDALESSVAIRFTEIYQERTRRWYAFKTRATGPWANELEVMRKHKKIEGRLVIHEI